MPPAVPPCTLERLHTHDVEPALRFDAWRERAHQWVEMLRQGPSVRAAIIAEAIPERALLARVVARDPDACVLITDPKAPFVGAGRGRAMSMHRRYDPLLWQARARAVEDASGLEWQALLGRIDASHVLVRVTQEPALLLALRSAGYVREDQQQGVQAWRSPRAKDARCGKDLDSERLHRRRVAVDARMRSSQQREQ